VFDEMLDLLETRKTQTDVGAVVTALQARVKRR
jgi:hypothetical protein